jgi:hypothetical protein
MAYADIDALRMQGYSTNLELLSQQMPSLFLPYCRQETAAKGTKAYRMLSQLAQTSASLVTTRAQDVDDTVQLYDGRWVHMKAYTVAHYLDDINLVQTSINPESQIMRGFIAALNRQVDNDFLTAFFGTAKTDETGGTSTSFTAANQVSVNEGVGTATGMNVAKLRAARKILAQNFVNLDYEQAYVAVTPKQYDDLLALTQVTSTDFNSRPVLVDGKLKSFMGFNIIECNLLPTDGSSYRRCPVWVASGMGCAMWEPISGDIRRVPNKQRNPMLLEANMMLGLTRLEEAKCVEIKCSEA